jgi:hypothetical protein
VIPFEGGASEPSDTLLPGKAGGAVAVRRTLATTICRVADPTQVARPRQLRDASTVMRFRPAHQSLINRRHDDRASCLARQSLNQLLPREPQIHAPATWKGGHESGIALAEFGELIEIAIVEFGAHRLQQVKSAAGITNDPIGIERVSPQFYLNNEGRTVQLLSRPENVNDQL